MSSCIFFYLTAAQYATDGVVYGESGFVASPNFDCQTIYEYQLDRAVTIYAPTNKFVWLIVCIF